jgi:alpha-1,2-mannosyltransferase
LVLFLATFTIFALTACRAYTHIDAHAATVESWKIAATGTPWLEDSMDRRIRENKYIGAAPNGHVVGQRMAGPVIAGIPFYWLLDRDPDVASFSLVPGGVAAAAWTASAVLLMFLALRPRLGTRLSVVSAAVFAFGTPTWSVSANMLWTHPVTQFGLAGAAFAASRSRWWLAGMCLGVGMLGRPHLALVAAILGVGMSWAKRDLKPLLQVAVPTIAALGLLLVWNRWMFGVWSIGGAYGGKAEAAAGGFHGSDEWSGRFPQVTNYLGFLLSPDRGLLVWTPVVLLLVPALRRGWREFPTWSKLLALGGFAYTFVQLRINYFPGGDGFYGYRHGLELLTCLTPLLAFALPWSGRLARRLMPVVAAMQVGAIMLGAVTETFLVNIDDVWTDNSLWLALRGVPATAGTWMALWAVVGVMASVLVHRRLVTQSN